MKPDKLRQTPQKQNKANEKIWEKKERKKAKEKKANRQQIFVTISFLLRDAGSKARARARAVVEFIFIVMKTCQYIISHYTSAHINI